MIPKRRKAPKMGVRQNDTIRSDSHKKWVRGFPCCIEGKNGHVCEGRIEAMHLRLGAHAGMAQKPGDDRIIPGCSLAHREQHNLGEATWAKKYGVNPESIAADLWRRSPHRRKHEQ